MLANLETEVNFLMAERARRSQLPFMWSMQRPSTRDEDCHFSCQSCMKDKTVDELFKVGGALANANTRCTTCTNEGLFVHAETVYRGLAVGRCTSTGVKTGDPLFEFGVERVRSDIGSIPTLIVNSCVKSQCKCVTERDSSKICQKRICNRLCYIGGDNTHAGQSAREAPARMRKDSAGGGLVPGGRYVQVSEHVDISGDERVVAGTLSIYSPQKHSATGVYGTVLHSHASQGIVGPSGDYSQGYHTRNTEARCLFNKVVYCEANPHHNAQKCADQPALHPLSQPDTLSSIISRLTNILVGTNTETRDTSLGESTKPFSPSSQWCAKEHCAVTKQARCHAIMPLDTTGTREPTEDEKAECGRVAAGAEVCEPVLRMF